VTELSQAERTAIKAYVDSHGTGTHPMFLRGAEAGWQRGRDYGRERERVLREALEGIARATLLAERYGEAIVSISAALNAEDLNDKGRIMQVRGLIAGLDKSQPDHGPGGPDERPIWNLFCPECEQTSVDTGDGSCETCGTQTISVVQAGESNG
jgi:hypothetical protein